MRSCEHDLCVGDEVYFRQTENLYQHMLKGTIIFIGADNPMDADIYKTYYLVRETTHGVFDRKIYENTIYPDGEREYLDARELYRLEAEMKDKKREYELFKEKVFK